MKIVIHGNTKEQYSWFVLTTKDGCLRNNHEVQEIDFKSTSLNNVRNILNGIKPDIIFTHLTFHGHKKMNNLFEIYQNCRKNFGTKVIHSVQDARTRGRYEGDISKAFDFALIGQTESLNKLSKIWNVPTFYWPYTSLTYDKIAPFNKKFAFKNPVFTGNPISHSDRTRFIKFLQKLHKIEIFKTKSNDDKRNVTPELSSSASCILGLCTGYNIKGYIDVRPFQYLGCGAFMIIRKFKNMDDIIPDDLYIPFNGYEEKDAKYVIKMFKKYKNEDTSKIRQKAFNFIQKYHSSEKRMKDTIDLIMGKRNNIPVRLDEI